MGTRSAFLVVAILPWLTSCTTLATGITAQPPGIHPNSFRACLLDNGFFTPTALVGQAKTDYEAEHHEDTRWIRTREKILKMPGPAFIALTAQIMRDDLMPHLQYGGADQGGGDVSHLLRASANRPYGENREGKPDPDKDGYAKKDVPSEGDREMSEISVNRYLDCYLAPVGHEPVADENTPGLLSNNDGDLDLEGRMLRAHILLTLAAGYGAELLSARPSSNLAARAERLLTHVRAAEEAIRSSSPVMNPTLRDVLANTDANEATISGKTITIKPDPPVTVQMSLRWTATATRILRVFQVAADIEMIDARQSLDRAKNLLAAFSQPSSLLFEGVLKDALRGFGTIQKVRLAGDAMLRDSRETLAAHRRRLCPGTAACRADFAYDFDPPGKPARADRNAYLWNLWDRQLARACAVIASAAKQENAECIPDTVALEKLTKSALPAGS